MSLLTELRTLLIEVRMTLRAASQDFDEHPLRARLDESIRELGSAVLPPPAASTKSTAQQVALAWQTVCRGLKLSQPPLYDELAGRVMALLDERELVEPVNELLQLEAQVKKLEAAQKSFEARLSDATRKAADAQQRLEQLHAALAEAIPEPMPALDAQGQALQRIEALASRGPSQKAAGGGGKPAAAAAAVEGPVPTRAVLDAVVALRRSLTRDQREWCVAECLALTGWQFTPLELIEKGDPWLAQQILDSPNPPH